MILATFIRIILVGLSFSMIMLQGGCASLRERVAGKIEYIVPREGASPGDVFKLSFDIPPEIKKGYVNFLSERYRIFPRRDMEGRIFSVFLPIPKIPPGQYSIQCIFKIEKEKKTITDNIPIKILPDFTPRPIDEVRAKNFRKQEFLKERARIKKLLEKSVYKPEKIQDFILPLGGKIVSNFGTIRRYNQKTEIALEGVEIVSISAGARGVNAAAEGLVRLAEKLPMLGNTILIDHGFSFATLYCHLKKLEVKAGQIIKRGQLLGEVGQSGGAAVGRRLLYQMFVSDKAIDVKKYTGINIFD